VALLDVAPHRAIRELEEDLALSPETLAVAIGVDKRSVLRWREGTKIPRSRARDQLAELYNLRGRLLHTFEPEDARTWMTAPNPDLGGFTPDAALRTGDIKRVSAALEALETGAFI
jgi:hypothetical protein